MWVAFSTRCRIDVVWVGEVVLMVTREGVGYRCVHVRFDNVTWYLSMYSAVDVA